MEQTDPDLDVDSASSHGRAFSADSRSHSSDYTNTQGNSSGPIQIPSSRDRYNLDWDRRTPGPGQPGDEDPRRRHIEEERALRARSEEFERDDEFESDMANTGGYQRRRGHFTPDEALTSSERARRANLYEYDRR
jgi:hypothetical protein